jgi:hypothetical protein
MCSSTKNGPSHGRGRLAPPRRDRARGTRAVRASTVGSVAHVRSPSAAGNSATLKASTATTSSGPMAARSLRTRHDVRRRQPTSAGHHEQGRETHPLASRQRIAGDGSGPAAVPGPRGPRHRRGRERGLGSSPGPRQRRNAGGPLRPAGHGPITAAPASATDWHRARWVRAVGVGGSAAAGLGMRPMQRILTRQAQG